MIPNNARPLRITAAAGTQLAGAYSGIPVTPGAFPPRVIPPPEKDFTTSRPSSSTRRRSLRLPSIVEDSSLLPPVGVWAVLNPNVAVQPLSPATHRRLGGPLPRQLANGPRARPPARPQELARRGIAAPYHAVLSHVSMCYSPPEGRLPTCYSPVRHFRPPEGGHSSHLHA